MLISNDVDRAYIGKNLTSLISGISRLKRQDRVLIIDDHHIKTDLNFFSYLSHINKEFLKVAGIVNNVDELKQIDKFLNPLKLNFFVGPNSVHLSGNSYQHTYELSRKFANLFPFVESVQDDQDCSEFILNLLENIAEYSYRFKNLHTIDNNLFSVNKSKPLSSYFDNSFSAFNNQKHLLETRAFMTLMKYCYHREIVDFVTELEFRHLFLCLLSPIYYLDIELFNESLTAKLESIGGLIKKSSVEQWQLDGNRLVNLQLQSFEGVLGLNRVYIHGHMANELPFDLRSRRETYSTFSIKIRSDKLFKRFLLNRILYTTESLFSSDYPLIDCYVYGESLLTCEIPFAAHSSTKLDVKISRLKEILTMMLKDVFAVESLENIDFEFDLGTGKVIRRGVSEFEKIYNQNISNLTVHDQSSPSLGGRVHGVEYWGVLRNHGLGLYSYLMDLKETHEN